MFWQLPVAVGMHFAVIVVGKNTHEMHVGPQLRFRSATHSAVSLRFVFDADSHLLSVCNLGTILPGRRPLKTGI